MTLPAVVHEGKTERPYKIAKYVVVGLLALVFLMSMSLLTKSTDSGNKDCDKKTVCKQYTQRVPLRECPEQEGVDDRSEETIEAVFCSEPGEPCAVCSIIQAGNLCWQETRSYPMPNGKRSCPVPVSCTCVVESFPSQIPPIDK